MPTSSVSFAAVAACLAGIDPLDRGAVSRFYRRLPRDYPPPARALIADFLIGLSGPPPAWALQRLKWAVTGAGPAWLTAPACDRSGSPARPADPGRQPRRRPVYRVLGRGEAPKRPSRPIGETSGTVR